MLALFLVTNPQKLSELDLVGSFFLTNVDMFQLVLPISWSLSYELYFYFLFLFTFFFSIKQLYVLIPVWSGFILLLVLYAFFVPEFPKYFFYSPFLLEFFAGVLLYMYKEYFMKLWMLPLSILIVVIAYSYGITYETKNGLFRVLTFGIGALFTVLAALILEQKNVYRAGKQFEALGNASYTLYLSHLIIIQLFYLFGLRGLFSSEGAVLPLFGLFTMISLTVIFSLVYYQKIEKPVYQKAIRYKRVL
jgi:peptidoglycan/LPS O-acetylase OafA/YrhL